MKEYAKKLLGVIEKPLVFALITLFPVALLLNVWLENYYGSTMPRTPIADSGHIHPLNIHGTIVYLTRRETIINYLTFLGGGAAALLGAYWAEKIKRRKR